MCSIVQKLLIATGMFVVTHTVSFSECVVGVVVLGVEALAGCHSC